MKHETILLVSLTLIVLAGCKKDTSPVGPVTPPSTPNPERIFAGTSGRGAFLSTDTGTSWTQTSMGYSVNVFALSHMNLFAGTDNYGVFLSTNNGSSWITVNNGLTNTYVITIAFSGTNLFAGTYRGVFLSTNNGTSWSAVNTGLINEYVAALIAVDTTIFAGTPRGVFLSTNNGMNWAAADSGLTGPSKVGGRALAVSGTNRTAVDTGVAGADSLDVRALAISGTNLFASILGNGVFLSTNNGTSWASVNTGLPASRWVTALAASDTNVLAGTSDGDIVLSNNGGFSWRAASGGALHEPIWSLAVSGWNVFAGTENGVYRSTDGGNNWMQLNNTFASCMVTALLITK